MPHWIRPRGRSGGWLACLLTPALAMALHTSPARAACAPGSDFGAAVAQATGAYPAYMASADFNGDGRTDVAVCEYNAGQLTVYLNMPEATATGFRLVPGARVTAISTPRACEAADFNEDGVPDLAVVGLSGAERLTILLGTRGATGFSFGTRTGYTMPSLARCVTAADFDADGILDLAVGTDGSLLVYRGNGTAGVGNGTFAAPEAYATATGLFGITACDLNGDGVLDLAGCIGPSAGSRVLFGAASGGLPTGLFYAPQSVAYTGLGKQIRHADMNGDGREDLVIGADPGVVVVLNLTVAGTSTFAYSALRYQFALTPESMNDLQVADLDADGTPDVVTTSASYALLNVLPGAVTGSVWAPREWRQYPTLSAQAVGLVLDDLNGDGRADAVVSSVQNNTLILMHATCFNAPLGQLAVGVVPHGPGSVTQTPAGPFVTTGVQVNEQAVPDAGAQFLGWSGLLSGAANPVDFAATRDGLVHAWFAHNTAMLDVTTTGSGSVMRFLDLASYPESVMVTLLARSADHQAFLGWSGDLASSDSVITVRALGTVHLTANFVPQAYSLTINRSPGGYNAVTRTPDQANYIYGEQVQLTAVPEYGYTFTSWTGLDAGSTPTDNPATITITGNRVVQAIFTPVQFPIDVVVVGQGTANIYPSGPTAAYNYTIQFQASPMYGHVFRGWTGDLVSAQSSEFVVVRGPMHVVANFDGDPAVVPHISSVKDVPADQGGHLRLRWTASTWDMTPPMEWSVASYLVWRSVPATEAQAALASGAAAFGVGDSDSPARQLRAVHFGSEVTFWEYVGTTPAVTLESYSMDVPTTTDSSAVGAAKTLVFVQANSTDGTLWWNSAPDSGHSVDNIAPPPPGNPIAQPTAGGVHLTWASSFAADLAGYRVHRGTTAGFVPDAANRVASITNTQWDLTGRPDASTFIKLVAVDTHDNPSVAVLFTPQTLDVAPRLSGFTLAPLRPNPSRGELSVEFSLEREGDASIEMLDVSGRIVSRQALPQLSPGAHQARLASARVLPAGLYFVRLTQDGRQALRRVAIVP